PLLAIEYFGLNFQQPPFDSLEVRQAFALALNKQLLVDRVYRGGAIPTNHIVPRGNPGYNPDLFSADGTQSLTGDQKSAQSKLQAAIQKCKPNVPQPDYCPYITNGKQSTAITIVWSSVNATRGDLTARAAQQWSDILNLNVQPQEAAGD